MAVAMPTLSDSLVSASAGKGGMWILWVTIAANAVSGAKEMYLEEGFVKPLIKESYDLVVSLLPKYIRERKGLI